MNLSDGMNEDPNLVECKVKKTKGAATWREAGKLRHQESVAERLTAIRNSFDDAQVNLLIEAVNLHSDCFDSLMLAHGRVLKIYNVENSKPKGTKKRLLNFTHSGFQTS